MAKAPQLIDPWRARRLGPAVILVLFGAGCGTDGPLDPGAPGGGSPGQTGVPQPVPIPAPTVDGALVRATGAPVQGEGEIHVVGLPKAASRAGQVRLENLRLAAEVTVDSMATGSFSAFLLARSGDQLRLTMVGGEQAATFEVQQVITTAFELPPKPIPGVEPITDLGGGRVAVRGQSTATTELVAVNLTSGAVAVGTAGDDGTFTIELEAGSGDEITVYNDNVNLGASWSLTVP